MTRWIIIGVSVVTVILIGFLVAAILYAPFREGSWQIAVTLLAVLQMISAILMVAILFAVLYAINAVNKLARENVVPRVESLSLKVDEVLVSTRAIADNVKEATSTATSTTSYVAEKVVAPVIRVSGLMAGVRATATTLARRGRAPEPNEGA